MAGFLLSAAGAFGHTCGVRVDGAFGPEGCGIALSGDEYEVSVTDLPFCIIPYEKHYVDQPPPVAFPFWRQGNWIHRKAP